MGFVHECLASFEMQPVEEREQSDKRIYLFNSNDGVRKKREKIYAHLKLTVKGFAD